MTIKHEERMATPQQWWQSDAGAAAPAAAPAPVGDAAPAAGDVPADAPVAASGAPAPMAFLDAVPDNWREQLAGENTKRLNDLKRVPDFGAFADRYFNAQEKIRSGQIAPLAAPTNDSTPEEIAEWRELHNVPATADEYKLTLDEGLVLGESDEAVMSDVFAAAHSLHVSPAVVSQLANAMLKGRENVAHQAELRNEEERKECVAALRETWRGSHDTNINMVRSTIVGALPESVRDAFAGAVMADGRKVFNTPEVLIAMADWARKLNPSATVVPESANPMQTINDEIKSLESKMGTPEWYKDEASQKRYLELTAAKENLTA